MRSSRSCAQRCVTHGRIRSAAGRSPTGALRHVGVWEFAQHAKQERPVAPAAQGQLLLIIRQIAEEALLG